LGLLHFVYNITLNLIFIAGTWEFAIEVILYVKLNSHVRANLLVQKPIAKQDNYSTTMVNFQPSDI